MTVESRGRFLPGTERRDVGLQEWLLAILIALALTLILQIPYWLGYASAAPGTVYTGLLVNVEDANYITIIQRGIDGAWMHSLRFTSEPDTPAFLYGFYLAWGHLARLLRIDATSMWHVARGVMTFVTCVVAFKFVSTFTATRSQRMVAYVLTLVGGGFDWVAFPWETFDPTSATPVDLRMADAHFFYAALTFPHYLGSILLLMILFWCAVTLLAKKIPQGRFWLLLSLGMMANLGVTLVQPFFVILTCGVLGMYGLFLMLRARRILWREGLILATLAVPVLPLAIYYGFALSSSELLRVWVAQALTLSPSPLHYILTFAPYLIPAFLSVWGARSDEGAQFRMRAFLWAWVLVVALLVYAPIGAQRRFLQGVQVPLSLLATFGVFEVALPRIQQARWFQELTRRPNYSAVGVLSFLVVFLLLIVSMTSVYQWLSALALTTILQPYPIFRPRGEVEAMDWLRTRAQPDDVVLSTYFTGSYLPLHSGVRAYVGHYYETIHFEDKERNALQFFAGATSDDLRKRLLAANHIRYLFYGRAEQAAGTFAPGRARYLVSEFKNNDAVIYRFVMP